MSVSFCAHRRNTLKELTQTPSQYGIEMDVRSYRQQLVVTHEPFEDAVLFDHWLSQYKHDFLIVNIKEEGLEAAIQEKLTAHGVEKWAFLDQSFPFMMRHLRSGRTNTMVRVSEYESLETALQISPKADWVWLDSFTGVWFSPQAIKTLHNADYKIMVVSPELQGRDLEGEMQQIVHVFELAGQLMDGVCTKFPEAWQKYV